MNINDRMILDLSLNEVQLILNSMLRVKVRLEGEAERIGNLRHKINQQFYLYLDGKAEEAKANARNEIQALNQVRRDGIN